MHVQTTKTVTNIRCSLVEKDTVCSGSWGRPTWWKDPGHTTKTHYYSCLQCISLHVHNNDIEIEMNVYTTKPVTNIPYMLVVKDTVCFGSWVSGGKIQCTL